MMEEDIMKEVSFLEPIMIERDNMTKKEEYDATIIELWLDKMLEIEKNDSFNLNSK